MYRVAVEQNNKQVNQSVGQSSEKPVWFLWKAYMIVLNTAISKIQVLAALCPPNIRGAQLGTPVGGLAAIMFTRETKTPITIEPTNHHIIENELIAARVRLGVGIPVIVLTIASAMPASAAMIPIPPKK